MSETERPITINQEWADGWGPRMRAAKAEVRRRYAPTVIPPCRVCGMTLSLGAIGGGNPTTWGCSEWEDDPARPGQLRRKEGRSCADGHYGDSMFIDRRHVDSDAGVIIDALLDMLDKESRGSIPMYPIAQEIAETGLRIVEKELGL
jgi:hypothetical protein